MSETRKIADILVADVVGYSRLVGADEDRTLARLRALRSDLIDPIIAVHHGRVVKRTGDGAIVEFRSAFNAARCAPEMQDGMVKRNAGLPPERRIEFRIGIHLGDVVEESDGDLMGDGVNIAARLEGICEPGRVCISEDIFRQVRDKIEEQFVDLGEQLLKNIARPVRAYHVISQARAEPATSEKHLQRLVLLDRPSIAVLPFQNMSGDAEQEYLADGVVEDLITALSRFKSFSVIARNSSFIYKGRSVDVRQVAKELGVRYVLEGSVRRSGSRMRITAQLVDGETGGHLWASKFDGAVEDIFDVQDKITESVVAVVEPHIQQAEINRSRRERPGSLAAYDLYLRALQKLSVNRSAENAEAVELLHQANALESGYAIALAYAAYGYEHNVTMGWPPLSSDDRENSLRLARAALAVAEDDATVLARCGMVLQLIGREYDQGLLTIKRAVDANPNNLTVIFVAGYGHFIAGSLEEALALFNRAIRLSPGDTSEAMCGLSLVKTCLGHYEEALDWAGRALAVNPNWRHTYWTLIADAHLGRLEDAKRALSEFLKLEPSITRATIKSASPNKYPGRIDVFIEGMRLAGMPEV